MKAKAQPNVGRALEVTPFKFLLRAVVVEQPVLQHDFSHELSEHVVQERLGGCQHARSEACEVGSEVRVSAAAVFPSRESDTHSKHTSRRLRRSEGVAVGKCCVRVGTVPLEPQSEAVGARERSALGLSVLKLQVGQGSAVAVGSVSAELAVGQCRSKCAVGQPCVKARRFILPRVCSSRALWVLLAFFLPFVTMQDDSQMSVMERRMRELGAMSSSASSRRAIVVAQGRLAQSQDVEEARQSQEIAGVNANDFVEKVARPWHGLTLPRLPGANPPPGSLSPCTPSWEPSECDERCADECWDFPGANYEQRGGCYGGAVVRELGRLGKMEGRCDAHYHCDGHYHCGARDLSALGTRCRDEARRRRDRALKRALEKAQRSA